MGTFGPEAAAHLANAHEYSEAVARASLEAEGDSARALELMQERQAGLTSALRHLEEATPELQRYRELLERATLYGNEIEKRKDELGTNVE